MPLISFICAKKSCLWLQQSKVEISWHLYACKWPRNGIFHQFLTILGPFDIMKLLIIVCLDFFSLKNISQLIKRGFWVIRIHFGTFCLQTYQNLRKYLLIKNWRLLRYIHELLSHQNIIKMSKLRHQNVALNPFPPLGEPNHCSQNLGLVGCNYWMTKRNNLMISCFEHSKYM